MRKVIQCSVCGKESLHKQCSMSCRARSIMERNQRYVLLDASRLINSKHVRERICSECGEIIPKTRGNYRSAMTCNDVCGKARDTRISVERRRKKREKNYRPRNCAYCKHPIEKATLLRFATIYCSRHCRGKASIKRRKKRDKERNLHIPKMVGIQKWLCKGVM